MSRALPVALGPVALRLPARPVIVGLALLAVLAAAMIAALCLGEYPVSVPRAFAVVLGQGSAIDRVVIGGLRLPRVLAGALVGIALGISGALFQSVSRNPLGSPDVIGFTSGASTGALLAILVLHAGVVGTALGSLAGGVVTAVLVYGLSVRDGVAPLRLVLVGIGAGSMLSAVNSLLVVRAQIYDAQSATAWLIGNLAGSDWTDVLVLTPVTAGGLVLAALIGGPLGLAEFSDERVQSLGAHPQRIRVAAVSLGVPLAAAAVATAGPIAFIALTAPQIARRLTRGTGPHLFTGGLVGAVLLVLADLAAQEAFQPREYAVGVVTGVVGGGYLAWLLGREWKGGRT